MRFGTYSISQLPYLRNSHFCQEQGKPGPAPRSSGRRSGLRASVLRLPSALHNSAGETENRCFEPHGSDRSAQCQPRRKQTATALCPAVRSLRRSTGAALSSSAPIRPPLRLEPYPAGWLFILWVLGADQSTPCRSRPDCRGKPGLRRLAPHAARGPVRTLRPDRPQNHRPTQPGALPAAGNENKAREPGERRQPNRSTGPPVATRLAER